MSDGFVHTGFGRGGHIMVAYNGSEQTAEVCEIEGALIKDQLQVRQGSISDLAAELRRLLDYAAAHQWMTEGRKRYAKGIVNRWERSNIEQHQSNTDE